MHDGPRVQKHLHQGQAAVITPLLCVDGWDVALRGEITPRAVLGKKQVVVKLPLRRVSHPPTGL